MGHSNSFFRDEIRNGFYVPTAVKQAWAATLDVLSEIDRICEKYGITYYADWGSVLGAVRHGGFIPWDDDLDICMKREDYKRFREVADKELPPEYDIHDYERHENHWLFLARVVNNKKICFDPDYLNSHYNLPWLVGVDIFVKDYLYSDPEEEAKRDREILDILAVADSFTEGRISRNILLERAKEIGRKYNVSLPVNASDREMAVSLYRIAETQMARVDKKDSGYIGQIFPWILKRGIKGAEPSVNYEKVIRLPFEDTTIPVPACYNNVLKRRYGSYNVIRKVWGGHEYPFYEGQKKELMRLSGGEFPGFKFSPEMLNRPEPDSSGSLKSISNECIQGLEALYNEATSLISSGDMDNLEMIFQNSQQLAADFGTLVENVIGENRESAKTVVGSLEKYCEAVYIAFSALSESGSGDMKEIRKALDEVTEAAQKNIINRKEICFMPLGPAEMRSFETEYEKACDLPDTDVYVVPLPLMTKDIYGNVTMSDEEISSQCDPKLYEGLVKEEHLTDYSVYDPGLHLPDRIYIQNPYDGENPVLTVPPVFYAGNLRKYTYDLCFCFIGRTSEFGKDDLTDRYNLKNYVTVPGVIYSDKVYVQSENLKEQYIEALLEFAGDDTEYVWRDKLIVQDAAASQEKNPASGGKKHILFCIGANELSEIPGKIVKGLKEKLEILSESSSGISVTVALYPCDRQEWIKIDKDLSEEIFSIIDEGIKNGKFEEGSFDTCSADETAKRFDAYYGSSSPYIPAFTTHGKPAMVADFSLMGE